MQINIILTDVSVKKVCSDNSSLSTFEQIQVIGGGHYYFYGDNYGFSTTQKAIEFSFQYELSDFIANYEDTDDNGLFNIYDINVIVNYLFDFNSDQNIDIFDVLTLNEFIY